MASGGAGLARTSARSSRSTRRMLPRRRSSSWPAVERCPPRRPSPPFANSTSTRRSSTRSLFRDLSPAVRERAPAVTRLLDPCPELMGGRVGSLRTVEGSSPSCVDGTRSRPAPAMRNQGRWSMGYEKTTETVERDPRDVHDETWTETKVTDHGTKAEGGKEAIGAGTGALGGAAVGMAVGGPPGAVVGGAIGAAGGAGVGDKTEEEAEGRDTTIRRTETTDRSNY